MMAPVRGNSRKGQSEVKTTLFTSDVEEVRRTFSTGRAEMRDVFVISALMCLALGGCIEPPVRPERPMTVAPPPPSLPVTQVIFYPAAGQTATQQDRDRYECHQWAVKHSGFDPGAPRAPISRRVEVVPAAPPGVAPAAGAITGAAVGAAVSRSGEAAGGAIIGAVVGAIAGAASDQAREQQAERIEQRYEAANTERSAQLDSEAERYRRAMTACLEARNYTVK
jgi:hypothetical protein